MRPAGVEWSAAELALLMDAVAKGTPAPAIFPLMPRRSKSSVQTKLWKLRQERRAAGLLAPQPGRYGHAGVGFPPPKPVSACVPAEPKTPREMLHDRVRDLGAEALTRVATRLGLAVETVCQAAALLYTVTAFDLALALGLSSGYRADRVRAKLVREALYPLQQAANGYRSRPAVAEGWR